MNLPTPDRRPVALASSESPTFRAELCLFVLLVAVIGSMLLAMFGSPGRFLKATTVLLQKHRWAASVS